MNLPPPDWYLPLAEHLGEAYLKYAFTYGTAQEVAFFVDKMQLERGARLLDVGCGPGRHSIEFAKNGLDVVGVDLSPRFIEIARKRAAEAEVAVSFFEGNALDLVFENEFDAVVSICEGAFSLSFDDLSVLRACAQAAKPGGWVSACGVNVFHVLKEMKEKSELDPVSMVYAETAAIIGEDGSTKDFQMWTSCFTPREMRWIANGAGLVDVSVFGAGPGRFAQKTPDEDDPELLLIGKKPEKVLEKTKNHLTN